MALLQENYLRNLAAQKINNDRRRYSQSSESLKKSILSESSINFSAGKKFDIFLSHSYSDKDLMLGLKIEFEAFGYSVYIDWIEDYGLNRIDVTRNNVLWIQGRMSTSSCLVYATSINSPNSKWMPWELGFMDGLKHRVAIIPISTNIQNSYSGQEYLGVYPYIEKLPRENDNKEVLWVFDQSNRKLYADFEYWIKNGTLFQHNN
jgi:hypothetical protein